MKRPPHQLSVSQLSLYNPARLSDDEIIASFAARQAAFERILADVAAEKPRSRAQHHLIVGQRGMGKSTLLARLAAELRTQPGLSAVFIPLVFAEEQYAVDRLSKFWLNCLDSLADACERAGHTAAVERIDYAVQQLSSRHAISVAQDQERAAETLEAFLAETKLLERRAVLLVDNLQLVFERISSQQQHALRELLLRPGAPLLIGASPSPPPESQDYGAAFYDHFKVHYLPPLSVDEMRKLMLTLAEKVNRPEVRERIMRHPHRLDVLRQLTGGNPRTTVTLFFLYAEDFAPSVFGDLENLLDRVTPLYKARFEELSPQQQVVASAVANHWDPITARKLSDATGLPMSGISPQLDRLEKTGFIERVELFGESANGFQIAERFFNVWFLMRSASRRQRREVEFLTRFIESFYEAQDRSRLAMHLQAERDFSPDRHLFAQALACTLDKGEARDLKRHAELDALRQKETDARRELEEVIDFSRLAPVTLAFDLLRDRLMALVPAEGKIDPNDFAEHVLGDRRMFQSADRLRIAARPILSADEIQMLVETVEAARSSDEATYGKEASAWLIGRLAGGQLAAIDDVDDWTAAIWQAPQKVAVRLLMDTIPSSVGARLPDEAVSRIRRDLQPTPVEHGWEWFSWGCVLHYRLCRFDEAEAAYRKAAESSEVTAAAMLGLGNILAEDPHRYKESEAAYLKAISRSEWRALLWTNLGTLFRRQGRAKEAEAAYRKAIDLDAKHAAAWSNLGHLLQNELGRHDEAEVAYRKAIDCDKNYYLPWNGLGNLYCDHSNRFAEAAEAFEKARELNPTEQSPVLNLIFLERDFLGRLGAAKRHFDELLTNPAHRISESMDLHRALFAAYAENWGLAREAIQQALARTEWGFSLESADDWLRATAVLLHLNYGQSLLDLLHQRGDHTRRRPWYESIVALQLGNRRHLLNLAPEVRTVAEVYFDEIEKRLKALPASTSRRKTSVAQRRQPRRQALARNGG